MAPVLQRSRRLNPPLCWWDELTPELQVEVARRLSALELAAAAGGCRGMRAAATRAAREAARAVLGAGFEVEEEEGVSWIAAAREAEMREYYPWVAGRAGGRE